MLNQSHDAQPTVPVSESPVFEVALKSEAKSSQRSNHAVTNSVSTETLTTAPEAPLGKPKLRGIPDVLASLVAIPATLMLITHARTTARLGAVVYGISLVGLFLVSASYHTFMWSVAWRRAWRRIDHAMVYVLIAGSYTPVCLAVLPALESRIFLTLIWTVTALGALKSWVWQDAPRWLNTTVYLAMGWLIVPVGPTVYRGVGPQGFALLLGGGIIYSIGALIYARRWPNPNPRVFGYHEVFHVFVVAAAACHFVTMWNLLT